MPVKTPAQKSQLQSPNTKLALCEGSGQKKQEQFPLTILFAQGDSPRRLAKSVFHNIFTECSAVVTKLGT